MTFVKLPNRRRCTTTWNKNPSASCWKRSTKKTGKSRKRSARRSQIEKLVTAIVERMQKGGRIFLPGSRHERPARRAGRLGDPADLRDAADAGRRPDRRRRHGVAESGGTRRRRSAAGLARTAGTEYLAARHGDRHRGIGHDPYVIGALHRAREHGILTACICSNPGLPAGRRSRYSDRNDRRAGTGHRQFADEIGNRAKLICNMITTATMIKLGRVKGNRMVNMQLTNDKLVDRGTQMVARRTGARLRTGQTPAAAARIGPQSDRRLPRIAKLTRRQNIPTTTIPEIRKCCGLSGSSLSASWYSARFSYLCGLRLNEQTKPMNHKPLIFITNDDGVAPKDSKS